MKIRYELWWCEKSEDDIHNEYFSSFDGAKEFADSLLESHRTWHGSCTVTKQHAERYSDNDGPYFFWDEDGVWEIDQSGLVEHL